MNRKVYTPENLVDIGGKTYGRKIAVHKHEKTPRRPREAKNSK